MLNKGKIFVVGFGPGDAKHITERAVEAIRECDLIIGYKTYMDLIRELISAQTIISTGMTEEVSRALEAVKQAEQGKKVAVISSGDSGVYGMAGLVYEVLLEKGWREDEGIGVEIVPGISAINSCASLLGAPIMHDSCTISLSDHLTPWSTIAKRVEAAAMADFVIALYNPRSGRRTRQIIEAQNILLKYRAPETPVGLVKSAYRERQQIVVTNLSNMLNYEIGMLTTVIIGNSSTFIYDNKMITPRGYQKKYTLIEEKQPLELHQRLQKDAEPWALSQDTSMQQNHRTAAGTTAGKAEQRSNSYEIAMEALSRVSSTPFSSSKHAVVQQTTESIFEFAVSPGVANKQFTPVQLLAIAEAAGEQGTIEYTPDHCMVIRIPAAEPERITGSLRECGLILSPIGNVVKIKACDFCDGEKTEAIPYADALQSRLGGEKMPKELNIGLNGCGMACYGAVMNDIGIVFRKGKFDLFLGAKPVGRTAHPGQPVAEGIEPDQLVELVTKIVDEYQQNAHPNERLFKYFKRVKELQGFPYKDITPVINIEPAPCGD
nr:precorrin-3B C(17)-methyltransferase [uncultured Bacillus sp.]